jgi:putative transposase
MARSVRVEFPGAFYHVMARGNRREPIFLDKEDGKQFVEALEEVCAMGIYSGVVYKTFKILSRSG